MHLICFDESGSSGAGLADTAQPVFVLVEKGFFIESHKSLPLQLCDLCAFAARKAEEQGLGFRLKPVDVTWAGLVEPLVHRGDEKLPDVLQWLTGQQKKERPRA